MTHVGNITRTEEGVQYRGGTQIRQHCIPYSTENPLAMAIFWKKRIMEEQKTMVTVSLNNRQLLLRIFQSLG